MVYAGASEIYTYGRFFLINKCTFLKLPMPFGMELLINFVIAFFFQSSFKISVKYTSLEILFNRNAQNQEIQNFKKRT